MLIQQPFAGSDGRHLKTVSESRTSESDGEKHETFLTSQAPPLIDKLQTIWMFFSYVWWIQRSNNSCDINYLSEAPSREKENTARPT